MTAWMRVSIRAIDILGPANPCAADHNCAGIAIDERAPHGHLPSVMGRCFQPGTAIWAKGTEAHARPALHTGLDAGLNVLSRLSPRAASMRHRVGFSQ